MTTTDKIIRDALTRLKNAQKNYEYASASEIAAHAAFLALGNENQYQLACQVTAQQCQEFDDAVDALKAAQTVPATRCE